MTTTAFTPTPGVDVVTTAAVDLLAAAPDAERFVGPDQAALEAMMAGMMEADA